MLRCAESIQYLLHPARPTGIVSTAVATARPTRHYRIVVVRLRYDLRTQAYMRRRTAEGMSKTEVIRCLKRYVAREVYSAIQKPNQMLDKVA